VTDTTATSSTADVGNSAVSTPASTGQETISGRTINPKENVGTPAAPPRVDGSATPEAGREGEKPRETAETKPPSRAEARIRDLSHQLREARDRASRLEAQNAELAKAQAKPPSMNDFDDPAEYAAALMQHSLDAQNGKMTRAQVEEARQQASEARDALWSARVEEFSARVPDWEATVVSDNFKLHSHAFGVLKEMEDGPQVAYFLAKNPDAARQITQLARTNPVAMLMEMGRISAKTAAPARVVSQAPTPIKTVTGGANSPMKTPETMNDEEYSAWYRERQKARSTRH